MKKLTLFFIVLFLLFISTVIIAYLFSQNQNIPKEQEGISPTPIKIEITKPQKEVVEYTCPTSGWVDCMPRVGAPASKACSSEAVAWYKQNCPNYQGLAY